MNILKKISISILLFSTLGIFCGLFLKSRDKVHSHIIPERTDSGLERLRSLQYLTFSEDDFPADKQGVVTFIPDRSFYGFNLYTDYAGKACIMDMNGNIIFTWHFPSIEGMWEHFELLQEGDIVALCVGECLAKITKTSEVVWIKNIKANHDIEVLDNGSFLVPVSEKPIRYNGLWVKFDSILRISPDGEILDKWSTFENLEELRKYHLPSILDNKH